MLIYMTIWLYFVTSATIVLKSTTNYLNKHETNTNIKLKIKTYDLENV